MSSAAVEETVHHGKARIAEGQRHRSQLSRSDHKELRPKERNFDPIDVLTAATEGRVPELLPIKWGRMSVSPFAFFRGAAPIMAADLGRLPHTQLTVQLCGDAHVQNLGSYSSPNGKLIFDFNDFDETIRGPWEWDVKRMATSLILAGHESGHSEQGAQDAAETFVETYRAFIEVFSTEPILQVARHQIHREKRIKPVSAALLQSKRATPADLVAKLCDGLHFRDLKPTSWPVRGDEAEQVMASLAQYKETLRPESLHLFNLFRPLAVGFKIVGTGSVGMRDYVVLMEGNGPSDSLFLQIKQEMDSAHQPYLPNVTYAHQGQRTAEGQRAIQPVSDLLLGWTTFGGHEFLVRQLNDHKGGIDLTQLKGSALAGLAGVAGELLARGHARSGDACRIHGYCGTGSKICKSIAQFASQYADQTEKDYAEFMAAIKQGKIKTAEPADA